MENLINFEDESEVDKVENIKIENKLLKHPLLVQDRMSLDLNNPFDKLEYRATHHSDPFECLEFKQQSKEKDPAQVNRESVT